jgi:hypothetical protein
MPLPVGSWGITTDGLGAGTLTIVSVDSGGDVLGTITIPGSGAIVGFFDAGSQTVNLSNVTNPAQTFYVFSGALFQVTSGTAKTHTTTDFILAGTYEEYPPGAAVSTGRWVASLSQKVKEKDKEEKEVKEHKDKEKEKEALIEKVHPDTPASFPAGDVASLMQQFALRLDAIEQRLATGQAFIGAEERPEVGQQAREESGEQ